MSKESFNNSNHPVDFSSKHLEGSSPKNLKEESTAYAEALGELDKVVLKALSQVLIHEKEEIEEAKFELDQNQPNIVDEPKDQVRHLMQSAELTGQAVQLEKISNYVNDIMKSFDVVIENYNKKPFLENERLNENYIDLVNKPEETSK
jgi:hypothetical protein